MTRAAEQKGDDFRGYDIIGDVHGCAETLVRLLEKMDYRLDNSGDHKSYWHPERQAIFLGDIIDRGPRIREALAIVRAMVESGAAQMILGNHEFNALAYCTPAPPEFGRDYLRAHSMRNVRQMAETLEQFVDYPQLWQSYLDWFQSLPLFLEWPHFRVVHACWDDELIRRHRERYGDGHFDRAFLLESAQRGTLAARTKQRLTSGIDLPLPAGMSIVSSDGVERQNFRTKFWAPQARTYGELLFQPDPLPEGVAHQPIQPEHRSEMVTYGPEEKLLFVGHYWLKGHPAPIADNIACLDYSAVKFGRLVAYRLDHEKQLDPEKFVWSYVDP